MVEKKNSRSHVLVPEEEGHDTREKAVICTPETKQDDNCRNQKECQNNCYFLNLDIYPLITRHAYHSIHNIIYFGQSTCKKSEKLGMRMMTIRAENTGK